MVCLKQLSLSLYQFTSMESSQCSSSCVAHDVSTVADKLGTHYSDIQSPKRSCLEKERKIIGTTCKPRSSNKAKFTAVTGHTTKNEFPNQPFQGQVLCLLFVLARGSKRTELYSTSSQRNTSTIRRST